MKTKILLTLSLIIFIATAAAISTLPSAQAENWQTVKTITGSSDQTTSTFTITANEWRIQWSYTPDLKYPQYSGFYFFVYPKGETSHYVSHVSAGDTQTSNTEYIYEGKDSYYLKILSANIPSYTITIQQNQVSSSTTNPTNTSNTSSTEIPMSGLVGLLVIIIIIIVIVVLLMSRKKTHPPVVQSQTMPPPPPTNVSQNSSGGDIAGRLDKLKGLLDRNLISKEEYENRKKGNPLSSLNVYGLVASSLVCFTKFLF